jgi:tellurium resistance protein TerD
METTATVNLQKGERVDLTKTNPGLKIANIGLGWDVNAGNGDKFDLDAFAMVLASGKLIDKNAIIYFNAKEAHGLTHMGDNLTGAGDGDDETIKLNLAALPPTADEVIFAVNIYEAQTRKQNFGMVNNAFVRIYNGETNQEILKFDLSENYSAFSGMLMGKIYKKDGEWKFQAIGEGKNGSIIDISAPFN